MSSPEPIKISVLGMGMSATVFHIPFILSVPNLFTLHSILERSSTSKKSLGRDLYSDKVNHLKVVQTFEQVVNDDEVECVVISTPNSTHFEYGKALLSAGKHIIVEKPLVLTSSEATELIKLAAAHAPPLVIATYQNRRWDSDFLTLRSLIDSGTFGEISELESRFDRWRPELKGGGTWKEESGWGQGVVFELGTHLIDQALTLFGTPKSIWGWVGNTRKLGNEDFGDAFLAHFFYPEPKNGQKIPLIVTLGCGTLSLAEPRLRFNVKGTKASFVKYGLDPQSSHLNLTPPRLPSDPSFGVESISLHGTLTTLSDEGHIVTRKVPSERGTYLSWYKNVAGAIQHNDPTRLEVKPEEAREVIRFTELIYQSHREGKVVDASE